MVPVARVQIVVNTDVLSQEQGIFTVAMIQIKVKNYHGAETKQCSLESF